MQNLRVVMRILYSVLSFRFALRRFLQFSIHRAKQVIDYTALQCKLSQNMEEQKTDVGCIIRTTFPYGLVACTFILFIDSILSDMLRNKETHLELSSYQTSKSNNSWKMHQNVKLGYCCCRSSWLSCFSHSDNLQSIIDLSLASHSVFFFFFLFSDLSSSSQ